MTPLTATTEWAAQLWPLAKKRALKRKTLTFADVVEAIPALAPESVLAAAWPLHVWCWVRGMPPLNIVIVKRGMTSTPEGGFTATDYDVMHEALGHSVYTLEHAWHYPWPKVPDPTPEQLQAALDLVSNHYKLLWDFRFIDLEMELRHRDEARGRRRPVPSKYSTWADVESAHLTAASQIAEIGLKPEDLRPPGKGPYPPPRPIIGNWAD